ncbi:CehA/McbA family metallohydrolase [Pseudonocardia nigra]|uniref:CehA/McbA family metallohydrolase n=1 Tax=Pseudonocardia nigra TaxID=1921578 RepID=UPI001C5E3B2A|nr:CehA/McbA family metallohydrolase [Pseudonocardia nigra]
MALAVHRGRFTVDDRAAQLYPLLPVEVPAGTDALTVRLDFDRTDGVLDLGCFGPTGFRGWSGGARETFTVAAGWATPGYLPGPLEPGTWHVCLGLHRVPADGLPYEVVVDAVPATPPEPPVAPPVPARPPQRALPAEPGLRWLAGDLHSHTVHSDGALTVDELACRAAAAGLDFLAVTDHNTVSHHPELPAAARRAGVALLAGQEVTRDTGHANAFGDIGWIDFRAPADDWLAETERRGGLLSVNHPLASDYAWRQPMTRRPRFAEVWHWTWLDRRWGGPLAWWLAWDPALVPLGGSDFHSPAQGRPLGGPTTWVQCGDDGDGGAHVLAGIAAGRVAISAGRDAPVLLRVGDELVAVDADGTYLVDPDGARRVVLGDRRSFPARPGPHRLETPDNAVVALTA